MCGLLKVYCYLYSNIRAIKLDSWLRICCVISPFTESVEHSLLDKTEDKRLTNIKVNNGK